jgi:hypothetical protein
MIFLSLYIEYLKVSEKIEVNVFVPLKDLFDVYSFECTKEYKFCGIVNKPYKYHSATYRDLFMKYLPLIQVYKNVGDNNTQAFVIRKNEGIQWGKLIETIELNLSVKK